MSRPNKNNTRRRGNAIAAFLFAAIILRAIIPLGYMPGNALAGEYLVLCPQGVSQELASALHLGHSADSGAVLDVSSACPIGQGLNHDVLPIACGEADIAPVRITWAINAAGAAFFPSFEPRYASRAPPLV